MKWSLRRDMWLIFSFIMYIIITLKVLYPELPEMIPSHFNSQGIADGYAPKGLFIFGMFGFVVVVYLLLTFIPFIDPLRKKIEYRYAVILFLRNIIVLFLWFVCGVSLYTAHTGRLEMHLFGVGFGLLFILLGNYLPRVPQNWFIGIRSPWTMSSDIVWKKTHARGGWLFILSGLVMLILSLMKVNFLFSLLILVPVIIYIGILYPFFLYKKLQKKDIVL
jgi:uncharacterized membrane protein